MKPPQYRSWSFHSVGDDVVEQAAAMNLHAMPEHGIHVREMPASQSFAI